MIKSCTGSPSSTGLTLGIGGSGPFTSDQLSGLKRLLGTTRFLSMQPGTGLICNQRYTAQR